MSSKISDACIKAAGAVYPWALLQFAYAAMVVLGAIIGQRWGVGGVAVCVSVAMGLNWLSMVQLSRSVTGLDWTRFVSAHAPAALLALVVGGAAAAGAGAGRSAQLGNVLILLTAGLAAAVAAIVAVRFSPGIFLGRHGSWAYRQSEGLLRRRSRQPAEAPELDALAPARKGSSKG
jgi:hypothetical protein